MSAVIMYAGGVPIVPDVVYIDSLAIEYTSGTRTHDILDGPPVHTLRQGTPNTGTLYLAFQDEQAALDCLDAHRSPAVFTIASAVRLALNFTYVLAEGRQAGVDTDRTLAAWTVTIPYAEAS